MSVSFVIFIFHLIFMKNPAIVQSTCK